MFRLQTAYNEQQKQRKSRSVLHYEKILSVTFFYYTLLQILLNDNTIKYFRFISLLVIHVFPPHVDLLRVIMLV